MSRITSSDSLRVAPALLGLAALACEGPTAALPHGASTAACGGCHVAQASEAAHAAHTTSGTSPVFEALLARVEERWGARAHDACVGCHSPGHGGDDGVGCVSCHGAVGNNGTRDGLLVIDLTAPLAGPYGDARASHAHETTTRGLLASPVLCGTCHEVTGPALLDEPTFTEHLESPAHARGLSCVDCHMPERARDEIAAGVARPRVGRSHRFVGVDPPWGAPAEVRAEREEETRALLAGAIGLSLERGETPGETVVVLANRAAGHAVPTGAAFLRDVWVDLRVTHADGTITEHARVAELGSELLAASRPVALLVDADEVRPRALAASETRRVTVALARDAIAVEATLYARAVRHDTLDALGLGDRTDEVPTHELATRVLEGLGAQP